MWDDGLVTDLKLIEILRELNAPAAFAISPNKHKASRTPNDLRGAYGVCLSKSELSELADFEIVNHTANHVDLGKTSPEDTTREINDGRKALEDIFQRPIPGFCYPYGVHTPAALRVLQSEKYEYARTTQKGGNYNLLLGPNGKWDEDINQLIDNEERLVIWGHTYEIQEWSIIRDLYTILMSRTKLVTFSELVKKRLL